MCWIDRFKGAQFTIVYSRFFEAILDADFTEDTIYLQLSNMTINKYVIQPFISTHEDFKDSDINVPDSVGMYDSCSKKMDMVRSKKIEFDNMIKKAD